MMHFDGNSIAAPTAVGTQRVTVSEELKRQQASKQRRGAMVTVSLWCSGIAAVVLQQTTIQQTAINCRQHTMQIQ